MTSQTEEQQLPSSDWKFMYRASILSACRCGTCNTATVYRALTAPTAAPFWTCSPGRLVPALALCHSVSAGLIDLTAASMELAFAPASSLTC